MIFEARKPTEKHGVLGNLRSPESEWMRAGEVSPQEFLQGRFHRRVRLGEDLLGFRRIVLDLVLVMPGSKEVRDCFVIHHLTFCKVGAPPVGVKY